MSKTLGILITLLFMLFPAYVKEGMIRGLEISAFSLTPSLFPYMVISGIFLNSGGLEVASEIFQRFSGRIFHFSKNACGGFVLSLFCGYPTGARISTELLKLEESNPEIIFGDIDAIKLRSCMTLFSLVSEKDSVFHRVLQKFFKGKSDAKTLKLLASE